MVEEIVVVHGEESAPEDLVELNDSHHFTCDERSGENMKLDDLEKQK